MADIYTKCHQVVIWLGKNEPWYEELCEELFKKARPPRQILDDRTSYLLMSLNKRPWFGRIWTLQEACLGCLGKTFDSKDRDPIIWSGDYHVGMRDLHDLSYSLHKAHPVILVFLRGRTSLGFYRPLLDDRKTTQSVAHFLLQVLLSFPGRKATNPLDYLYGLIGLAGEDLGKELPESLRPNYELKAEEVYRAYATHLLTKTQNLGLLNFSKSELKDVPSWVTDFRHLQVSGPIDKMPIADLRINGDVLFVKGLEIGTWAS
ncbi:hypothetical protein F4818DRAFT_406101 [Hypoxylon cercidicola]|nr:hypothetical protein F4818DRAFT_406101 [Hypoxylon cercidicola]